MNAIEEWSRAQERVIDVVLAASQDQMESTVPACPDWTARHLLSHMIGLDADVLAGDEADDHNAEWTQKQVDRRQDSSTAHLLAEWRSLTEPMQKWMAENNTRPLGDVVIHEQDLRGAFRLSGAQDTDGLKSLRDTFAANLADAVTDLPPLELRGTDWSWISHPGVDAGEVVVAAPDFDLARTLMSRRSEAQLRAWTVRGDIGPYLEHFAALGPLPDTDLTETF